MASRQFGVTKINPQKFDVTYDATGATLEGSNVLQVTYDDAAFTGAEGKQRLLLALRAVEDRLAEASTTWPAS